jgi:hypothetical protein
VSVVLELAQSAPTTAVAVAVTRAMSDAPTFAVTSTLPADAPSVMVVDAVPLASVTAVVGDTVALPVDTANVTVTPDSGESDAVVTSNTTGDARVLPTVPVCPAPLTAAIAAGVAAEGLVESVHAATPKASADATTPTNVLPRRAVDMGVIGALLLGVVIDNRSAFLS